MKEDLFQTQYEKLNTAQKDAVESIYGPVMVVAGPGTGKTQIIGLRSANIILKSGVDPSNILITTFTEAGVIAIRQRLLQFLGNDAYKVNVSTIHSFSQEVIKTFPEKFLEYKAGTPMDDVEGLEIVKEIIDSLIVSKQIDALTTDYDPYFYLRDIVYRIGNLKGEGISVSQLKLATKKQNEIYIEELSEIKPTLKKYESTQKKHETHINKLNELALIFDEYNKTLRRVSKYDFNDMINFVLEKFRQDEDLRYHYAEKFQFIMLDEYQDTNNAQNTIINLILSASEDEPNIMVVGDDDQSIYRFQGANIENMLDFSTHFKNTKFVVLENNYRSTQDILNTSSQLIDNNNERLSKKIEGINKKLIAQTYIDTQNLKPQLLKAQNDITEKAFVIQKIREKQNSGIENHEISIIVRGNKEVQEWTQILQENGIEADSKLKTDILKSDYITFILDYLKIIANPYSDEKILINLLRTNIIGLNQIDVILINRDLYIKNYTRKIKLTFIDYLLNDTYLDELHLNNKDELINFREQLLDFSSQLSQRSLSHFFGDFIEKTGILNYIESHGSFDDIQDIYTLFGKIKSWNLANKNLQIDSLLAKINLYKEYNFPIPRQILRKENSGVQVLTAHGSKGLEFETVFIPGLYTGNWDTKRVIDKLKLPEGIVGDGLQESNFEQIEEDRRLFFVAMTRAKKELYMSYPAGVGTKPLLQSRFIEEISGCYEEIFFESKDIQEIKEVVINNITHNFISFTDLEFDYIYEFLETYRLSPSDLNTFLEDPHEFLNRTIFKYPFIDNIFTIFGKVYHRTLELFYLKYKQEGTIPVKSYLSSTFLLLLEKEILTPEDFEKLKIKGIEGLEGYYDLYAYKSSEPLMLEYSFRRKNIFYNSIPLTGTIDKIEKIGENSQNKENIEGQMAFFRDTVALIDYKTGATKTPGVIKGIDRYGNKKEGEGKYFRQLMFYKLLCELDPEFTNQFDIGALAIDFVEGKDGNYKYIEVENTPEEFEDFKKELSDARSQITDINFWKELLKK